MKQSAEGSGVLVTSGEAKGKFEKVRVCALIGRLFAVTEVLEEYIVEQCSCMRHERAGCR